MSPQCPFCGSMLEYGQIDFSAPFRCPVCQKQLRVPTPYPLLHFWLSFLLAGLVSLAFGFRGYALFFATLVGWVPVLALVMILVRPVLPPRLKPYYPEHLALDFRDKPPK